MSATKGQVDQPRPAFNVQVVPASAPLTWIARGWDDLRHHPAASLAYGLIISVLGALILGFGRHPYFIAAAISGFLLVGPILSAGLCELSRLREHGAAQDFESSLTGLERSRSGLFAFAGYLLGLSVLWFVLSTGILISSYGTGAPAIDDTLWGGVLARTSIGYIVFYLGVGGALAVIVFAVSVVSVPLLIDRNIDALGAMRASIQAARTNYPAMVVWGVLIVLLTAVGYATFLIGMVVVFPLLGHATWHAYRDLLTHRFVDQ